MGWIDGINDYEIYLSVVTVGEIRKGIEKLPNSPRKSALHAWLVDDLLLCFEGRILLGVNEFLEWGAMVGRSEQSGRPLSAMDSLIAALSRYHGCKLVTRNEADFAGLGIPVLNPWNE